MARNNGNPGRVIFFTQKEMLIVLESLTILEDDYPDGHPEMQAINYIRKKICNKIVHTEEEDEFKPSDTL